MNPDFFLLMNIFLLSRWVFLSFTHTELWKIILLIIIQSAALLLLPNSLLNFVMFFAIIVIYGLYYYLEGQKISVLKLQIFSLLSQAILFVVLLSEAFSLGVSARIIPMLQTMSDYFFFLIPFTGENFLKANIIIFGALILGVESNNFINLITKKYIIGNTTDDSVDPKMLRAGRVIGVLERLFVYVFLLMQQYTAIGMLIAAKSFTRYKAMEKRSTAEYILVGTLLSVLTATFMFLIVNFLIS